MFETTKMTVRDVARAGFELNGSPDNDAWVMVLQKPRIAYLGYLLHDDDCENPLTSCDAMGKIVHHQRSRYGRNTQAEWDAANSDRDAVLLDLYDHSGQAWSVHGAGTQCRWDTSEGESVWVPDSCARDEIERRAEVYAFVRILEDGPADFPFHLVFDQGSATEVFTSWGAAFECAHSIVKARADTLSNEQRVLGRKRAAQELAAHACEEYTAWSNGDCWGVVVERHERAHDGSWVYIGEDYACWGFVGSDCAEAELAMRMEFNAKEDEDVPLSDWPDADLLATFGEEGCDVAPLAKWQGLVGSGQTRASYLDWVRAELKKREDGE